MDTYSCAISFLRFVGKLSRIGRSPEYRVHHELMVLARLVTDSIGPQKYMLAAVKDSDVHERAAFWRMDLGLTYSVAVTLLRYSVASMLCLIMPGGVLDRENVEWWVKLN